MVDSIRKRYTLFDKKELVEKFKEEKLLCLRENLLNRNGILLDISIKSFCLNNKIRKDSIFCNWLRMDRLGHLESWSGRNDLSKCNFKDKENNILSYINEGYYLIV